MAVKRYRATVEYDGSEFHGFQRQGRGERTVQEELEAAIQVVTGRSVTAIGAGRTDTGVHARGQVVAFDIEWRHEELALERALNANLPSDIAVREIMYVNQGFHPRFDARRRTYQYTINNCKYPSPLLRRTSWHWPRPLDLAAMNMAGKLLVGKRDFAAFGQPPVGENTVREVFRSEWRRENDLLNYQIEANAFLYRMVRSIVGSLCQVGGGAWSVERFANTLAAADRALAGPTAPPQGLCLLAVSY